MNLPRTPSTPQEWETGMLRNGLDPNSLSISATNSGAFHSASKLTETDFLHLKALWVNVQVDKFKVSDFVEPQIKKKADSEEFSDLVGGVKENASNDPHLRFHQRNLPGDMFTLFHYFRHLIDKRAAKHMDELDATPKVTKLRPRPDRPGVHDVAASLERIGLGNPVTPEQRGISKAYNFTPVSPATPSSSPSTGYEAIVNMALVSLLSLIRLQSECLEVGHWLSDPKSFTLHNQQRQPLLNARVDGYLHLAGQEAVFGILEVKPCVRNDRKKRTQIEWQETAQMAAWISETPGRDAPGVFKPPQGPSNSMRRLLISQDRHEIWITVAEYDEEYENYICDGRDVRTAQNQPPAYVEEDLVTPTRSKRPALGRPAYFMETKSTPSDVLGANKTQNLGHELSHGSKAQEQDSSEREEAVFEQQEAGVMQLCQKRE
ncbi:MAG: hypothetical protein Q9157_006342, partial [Trypethelium eluteriae]